MKQDIISKGQNIKEQKADFSYSIKDSAQLLGIGQDIFKSILTKFIHGFEKNIHLLTLYVNNDDFKGLTELSHRLKGACSNLNISEMVELFQHIEVLSKKEEKNSYKNELEKINSIYMQLKKII